MIIRQARLVPLGDADQVPAEPVDVRIEGEAVVEVGRDLAESGQVYDADGRWLMPGLWDAHVHLAQWTLTTARLDLGPATSVDHAVRLVAERLAADPGAPVIGWGHRPTAWPAQPRVADLDALGAEQPIVLIAGDGHHAWLNSHGLRALDLPAVSGVVSEGEWFAAYPRLDALLSGDETGPAAYRRTLEHAASLGIVGVADFEFDRPVSEWTQRWAEGCGRLRIRAATYPQGLADVIAAGLRTGDPIPGCAGLVTMGALKIISDGSLNTRTAWCCEAYAEVPGAAAGASYGQANQTPEELQELLATAHAHGLEVAVHAIGDRAVSVALDAFAATGARGSIEHAQLVRRDDVRRMAELGVRASVQPAHLLDDREVTERVWPGRADRCFALRWMVDAGVELAMGSDAPVARLDPWQAIAAAVHRGGFDDPWHPEQALTVREALTASVDGRGTVGVGSLADLALLDADPLDAVRVGSMTVAATWVAGALA